MYVQVCLSNKKYTTSEASDKECQISLTSKEKIMLTVARKILDIVNFMWVNIRWEV